MLITYSNNQIKMKRTQIFINNVCACARYPTRFCIQENTIDFAILFKIFVVDYETNLKCLII